MPSPMQCKFIGGTSAILGIAVLVVSIIFLQESLHHECIDIDSLIDNVVKFDHRSDSGGIHGGYFPSVNKQPHYGQYKAAPVDPNSHFPASPINGDSRPFYNKPQSRPDFQASQGFGFNHDQTYREKYLKYCPYILQKYKTCAIIGIVASIFQILVSGAYCCTNKNNVKAISLGWLVVHFIVLVTLIAIAAVVLAEKRFEKKNYKGYDAFRGKKLAFGIIPLIDAFFIVAMLLFVSLTWKKSDYDDYSVAKTDQELISKTSTKVLES